MHIFWKLTIMLQPSWMTFISKSTHWTSSSSCVQQCAAAPPPPAPPLPRGALTWPTPTHRVAQLTQTSAPLNELIIRIEHFNLMCLIFKKTVTENLTFVYCDSLMQRFPAVYVTILEIKISICMSVCLYVCLCVRILFPHSAKTNGPIFKIQTT